MFRLITILSINLFFQTCFSQTEREVKKIEKSQVKSTSIENNISNENSGMTMIDLDEVLIHPDAQRFAKEIYADTELYQTEKHLKSYSLDLARFTVIPLDKKINSFSLLSSYNVNTKYNPSIINDAFLLEFDVKNFNPLKYNFVLDSSEDSYIKIDNSKEWMIRITPSLN